MTRTVVVTGASAGVGRAAARAFAARGDAVALVARGRGGLDAAVAEIRRDGGRALAVPADVAEHAEVESAADTVEAELGPIDVWVNAAFASILAPFADIDPGEYERATRVTYLGHVNGTRAALARMLPRDHGTIVQVGSALSERSIPLQSAYCGAKHAINGFTSSLRTELMHQHSAVRVTVVQMPALNTPQFDWVRTALNRNPRPVAPIYQPEFGAKAVLMAADRPSRRQFWVGTSTAVTILANRVAPGLLDRYLAKTGYDAQLTDEKLPGTRPGNLFRPVDDERGQDAGAHGRFDDEAHTADPQLWLSRHRRAVTTVSAAAGLAVAAGGFARRSTK